MEAKQLRSNLTRVALNFAHYRGCMFKTISGAILRACQKFDDVGANENWTVERKEQIEFATEILRSCFSRRDENDEASNYDDPYEPALDFDDYELQQGRSESEPLESERPRKRIRFSSVPYVVVPKQSKRRGDDLDSQNRKRQRVSSIRRGRLTRNSQKAPILPKRVFGGQKLLGFLETESLKSSQAIISIDNRTKEAQINAIAIYHDDPIKTGYARLNIYLLSDDVDTRHSAFVYYCVSEIAKKVSKGEYRYRGIVFKGLLSEEFADLGAEQFNVDIGEMENRLKLTNASIRNMLSFIENRLNDRYCPIQSKTRKGTLCR